jgi:hypothetical protein
VVGAADAVVDAAAGAQAARSVVTVNITDRMKLGFFDILISSFKILVKAGSGVFQGYEARLASSPRANLRFAHPSRANKFALERGDKREPQVHSG